MLLPESLICSTTPRMHEHAINPTNEKDKKMKSRREERKEERATGERKTETENEKSKEVLERRVEMKINEDGDV